MAETALNGAARKVETNPNANTLPPIFNKPSEQEFSNGSLLDTCFDQYRQHKANSKLDALKAAYYRQVDLSKCLKKSQLSHCRKNGEEGCTLPLCPDLPTVSNAVEAPSAQCMQLLRERQCVVPELKCGYYNKDVWKTEPKYKGNNTYDYLLTMPACRDKYTSAVKDAKSQNFRINRNSRALCSSHCQ